MTRPRSIPICLACRQAPEHGGLCPSTDDEATYYLQHPLPGGHRDWTPADIRYTGTPGRRRTVRALMATTVWARMHDTPELPMSPGLLIKHILAEFGSTARRTARVGYTTDFLTTLDCACDPWRCIHDHDSATGTPSPDWLTGAEIDPDLLITVTLVAVELRWAQMWQTYLVRRRGRRGEPGRRLDPRGQPAGDQRGLSPPLAHGPHAVPVHLPPLGYSVVTDG